MAPTKIAKLLFLIVATFIAPITDQAVADENTWGNLIGRIIVEGTPPPASLERVDGHKDRSVCLVDGKVPADDQLVVGADGGLRDVFVILVAPDRGTKIPIHASYEETAQTVLELDNEKCRFVPHALAIRTDQPLRLKNSDSVGHNCKITSFNNEHNINLPAGGEAKIKLTGADRIPANVSCEIHPWMDALILAKDHPYVAISAADGSFEMRNVPAGNWELQFWHQRAAYLRKLNVPDAKVDRRGKIGVTIPAGQTLELGVMSLPAAALK